MPSYIIKVRGFTNGGFNETDPILARTGLPHKGIPLGSIVAAVVLLVMGVIVGGGYVMKRKGYLDPFTEAIQLKLKQTKICQAYPLTVFKKEMKEYRLSGPIKCKNFDEHIRNMMSDSHLKFAQEFEMLKKKSPQHPCTVAEMDENSTKNRWMNLLPFDHSRVKLLPLCDEPGSDFINANYIPGISSRREYIGSQGPLPNTVDDFWRMIWEQSVSMVVMITQCFERDARAYKKKCEQYWPNSEETIHYGDLSVTCVSESILSSYVIRIFSLEGESHEREVKQMQFTNWPDFGCPAIPEDLITFVKAVRDHLPRPEPSPILVHCSAGVGRTGTFIAVDILSQQLFASSGNSASDTIDVFATVLELRNHRTNMVQTEDQYIYVHMCIRQLIKERGAHQSEGSKELDNANFDVQIYSGI